MGKIEPLLNNKIWKTKKYHICQSSLPLWVGLKLINIHAIEQRKPTNQEIMLAIKSFPEDIYNCKCRDCTYFRMSKGK